MDGPAFAAYVRKVLVPEIEPGTVVVLDNLDTHRNGDAARTLRDHGCWLLYPPPYSPDLDPIEQAFSKLKAHLRRIGARSFTDVFDAIGAICDFYEPQECWNHFTATVYVSGQCRNALNEDSTGLRILRSAKKRPAFHARGAFV